MNSHKPTHAPCGPDTSFHLNTISCPAVKQLPPLPGGYSKGTTLELPGKTLLSDLLLVWESCLLKSCWRTQRVSKWFDFCRRSKTLLTHLEAGGAQQPGQDQAQGRGSSPQLPHCAVLLLLLCWILFTLVILIEVGFPGLVPGLL